MLVVLIKVVILVHRSFVKVSLQLVQPHQCYVVPYLYEDLIKWSVQRGEIGHPTRWRFQPSIIPLFVRLGNLSSSILMGIFLPFSIFWFAPLGYHSVFSAHVSCSLVQHICYSFWIVLVDGKEKIPGLKSIGESCSQDLVVSFIDQKGFFVESSYIRP